MAGISGLVGIVEGTTGVEQVRAPPIAPETRCQEAEERGGQHRGAVDHRGIDHPALPGPAALDECREYAAQEEHGAAAIVTDKIERRNRIFVRASDGVKDAGIGEVGQVVAGTRCKGAVLAEAGHTPVDEARIARLHRLRPRSEAFHDAGPVTLDQDIGLAGEPQQDLAPLGLLEVDLHDIAAVPVEIVFRGDIDQRRAAGHPLDAQDARAHLRQHQPCQRNGTDAGHLYDLEAGKRSGGEGDTGHNREA